MNKLLHIDHGRIGRHCEFVRQGRRSEDCEVYCLSTDNITNLTVSEVPLLVSTVSNPATCSVTALVLPSSRSSPTFRNSKQEAAQGQNIVIVKHAPLVVHGDQDYNTCFADILLGGRKAALVGHPGVGKSTELNIILVDLFRALADFKIEYVFHRVRRVLYCYQCSETEGDKAITCDAIDGVGDSLETLREHFCACGFEDMPRNNPSAVLVLELEEQEKDPVITMPTVLALSSRGVMTQLKTWVKTGNVKMFI